MAALFLRALTTACVVSVLLAVLLFPARQWMVRRYAPQVRWGLWCGMAAPAALGSLLFRHGCSAGNRYGMFRTIR